MTISRLKDILKGVYLNVGKDNLPIIAAGMAYYFILGLFPSLAAFVLIYGFFAEPAQAQNQIQNLGSVLPLDVKKTVVDQIGEMSRKDGQAGIGAVISLFIAFWSGSKASKATTQALNIVYGETETRGFIQVIIIGLGLTISGIFLGILALGLIVLLPPLLETLQLNANLAWLIQAIRWGILLGLFMTVLALLYRFAPDRKPPRWKWVTPGAFLATLLWLAGSFVFSWYVSSFGHFNETYGSFGAAIIFLLWLYISAFLLLLGAELNQQFEQTGLRKMRQSTASKDSGQ